MSLESQIQTLNENIGLLIAALKNASAAEHCGACAKEEAPAPKAESKAPKAEKTEPAAGAEPASDGADGADGDTPAPTYDDVKAAILKLSADKGREAAVEVLQRCGVAKAPDLLPEQYAQALTLAEEALAA